VLVAVLFFLFPRAILGIFSAGPRVIAIGAEWLRILSYSLFVYGWWMVSVQAFNGAGDTMTPTWINVVFFWLIQIPLAWYLALHLDLRQHSGVFWGGIRLGDRRWACSPCGCSLAGAGKPRRSNDTPASFSVAC
jgi:Na+-driven multidrug efflux pump